MNFNIITLGCKVNQYESQTMSDMLTQNGYTKSEDKNKADITIINTCTVTAVSDAKNRKLIHKARRNNPNGIIVLTGCMPQAFPDRVSDFEGCDIVLGNKRRANLIAKLDEFRLTRSKIIDIEPHDNKNAEYESLSVKSFDGHTRAFVKIEDGCNRFCSYCIIPYSRGRVRSKNPEELREEIKEIASSGYKEVVLVGINLSAYGQGEDFDLADAVDICCETEGIERVRLGSFEPEMMYDSLIKRFSRQKKFCPQFHLSLQSGCDATLKRMRRQYDTAEYMKIVEDLRKHFENSSITTDVMVGFAGETEEEFSQSLEFVKKVGFSKTHVFPYSRRQGTLADKMDNHVDSKTKDKRSKLMLEAADSLRQAFLESQVGLIEPVLVERRRDGGYFEGYTMNYTPIHIYSDEDLTGKIIDVKITKAFDDYCEGESVENFD
ncbi:MAG: tRNA (N(6)-L-threonylcarbamoyladenosine(37)-C(2))-methylthiotransferase MtaB [Ruminococcus sp.]|nr:tRNA (N(6)-L-threonylcarbamoyladenosine(37)-C(2))-methylthiotransferase MtaB [Ruminococcus sp.]